MSRPHFMPLLAPESVGRGLGLRSARSAAPAAEVARTSERSLGQVTCLGVTSSPESLQDGGAADAILRRVLNCGCPVGTVVLDLGAAPAIDPQACVAILTLHERLAALGTRLRLASSVRSAAVCLADEGVTQHIGRDAVHPSFRSAVLATYAALPGPGLVMGRVKTALETTAEPITPLARSASQARSLASRGAPQACSLRAGECAGGRPPEPRTTPLHPPRVGRPRRARRWTVTGQNPPQRDGHHV